VRPTVLFRIAVVVLVAVLVAAARSSAMGPQAANGLIAYSVELEIPGSHEVLYALCALDASGRSRRLTGERQRYDGAPAWSPDGERLAFTRERIPSGASAILVMDSSGRLRNVSGDSTADHDQAWSPDGRRIVFLHGSQGEIFTMNADGTDRRKIVDAPPPRGGATTENSSPRWSPDGRHIAFARSGTETGEIFLVNPDGSGETKLTDGFSPSWSADGRSLAFDTGGGFPSFVYTIRADGSGRRRVSPIAGETPAWSPNGSRIVFTRPAAALQEPADDLYVMRPDGSRLEALTRNFLFELQPTWQPLPVAQPFRFVRARPPCAILGTRHKDRLLGTKGADFVYARAGTDLVRAMAGPDVIDGGLGADTLAGGPGADTLGGAQGRDFLDGGPGNDVIFAGPGDDRLFGGRDADKLFGGTGRDRFASGSGADEVFSADGERDKVSCGLGRDLVHADRVDRVAGDCEQVERR